MYEVAYRGFGLTSQYNMQMRQAQKKVETIERSARRCQACTAESGRWAKTKHHSSWMINEHKPTLTSTRKDEEEKKLKLEGSLFDRKNRLYREETTCEGVVVVVVVLCARQMTSELGGLAGNALHRVGCRIRHFRHRSVLRNYCCHCLTYASPPVMEQKRLDTAETRIFIREPGWLHSKREDFIPSPILRGFLLLILLSRQLVLSTQQRPNLTRPHLRFHVEIAN